MEERKWYENSFHWAMQFGDRFEVLNEDIREVIREEIKKMEGMYGTT